jgi:ABC-type branched-subunit amino acid transport system substrate-binding protein
LPPFPASRSLSKTIRIKAKNPAEEIMTTLLRPLLAAALLAFALQPAFAAKQYGPGVSDSEVKVGQTMPYSGPVSAWATLGRAEAAYFKMLNEQGGVNGRKINLISLDDGYSPPRTVEQTRRLVEQDDVLAVFSPFGTPTNTAIQKYLNAKKVPHLFLAAIGTKWNDPPRFPWTMALWQDQFTESAAGAVWLMKHQPNAKIAVLYQNDDYGKDYLKGLKDALGPRAAATIVGEASYEVTDPTIDSQIIALKSSGADTLFTFASPKFAALSIRKTYDIGWKPLHIVAQPGTSVGSVLRPAGLEKSVGLIGASFLKDPTDPQWRDDPAMKAWLAWMQKYYPEGDVTDWFNVYGYTVAQALVHVLKQCGDNLTRESIMAQATSLKDLELPMLLPGIKINTSATDFRTIRQVRLQRFDGKQWVKLE